MNVCVAVVQDHNNVRSGHDCSSYINVYNEREREIEIHVIHFLMYVMLKNFSVKPRWQDVKKTAF